jgi:hypothetical protein
MIKSLKWGSEETWLACTESKDVSFNIDIVL